MCHKLFLDEKSHPLNEEALRPNQNSVFSVTRVAGKYSKSEIMSGTHIQVIRGIEPSLSAVSGHFDRTLLCPSSLSS